MRFLPQWSGSTLAGPESERPTSRGQWVRVTRLSAVLSQFALIRPDGSRLALPGRYAFIDFASGRLAVTLSPVPTGDYAGLAFTVGLPAAVDSAAPSQWPARHPLNPLTDGLYWGWRGGYVFFALEGSWRDPPAGAVRRGYSFHLTKDAGPIEAWIAAPFRVDGPSRLNVAIDLAGLLRPLRFLPDGSASSTHSRPGDPLAHRLAAAAALAFGFRGFEALPPTAERTPAAAPAAGPPGAELQPLDIPAGFPQPDLPEDNLPTRPGVALGRALFADRRLSVNGTQSCASCHVPARAFASGDPVSTGATGQLGRRHSPSLLNLAWNPAFAWDGSKPRIRDQALAAMTSPAEMGADATVVVRRLQADPALRAGFRAAFGTAVVTPGRIGLALEQYLLTLVSADSKFDRAARGAAAFTPQEKRGLELFLTEYDPGRGLHGADCFHCHGGALFSDFAYRDNGLGVSPADRGRFEVTHGAGDDGKFKTPSLRNVAVTGPYMHDGRFRTLAEVIAHYNDGVRRTANLDPNLAKHPDSGLHLSAADQSALVAFLGTLTDAAYASAATKR